MGGVLCNREPRPNAVPRILVFRRGCVPWCSAHPIRTIVRTLNRAEKARAPRGRKGTHEYLRISYMARRRRFRASAGVWRSAKRAGGAVARIFGEASAAPFSRTLVVTDSGVPVAAGVVTASLLHPQRLWTYLEVAEGHRRAGLGNELLDRLRETATENGHVPRLHR